MQCQSVSQGVEQETDILKLFLAKRGLKNKILTKSLEELEEVKSGCHCWTSAFKVTHTTAATVAPVP